MIEFGHKPCIHDKSFVDKDSWCGAFKRAINGECRQNMTTEIDTVIERAIDAITEYRDSEFLPLILDSLSRAKDKIEYLLETYQNRPDTVSKLKVCVKNIDLQLDKNRQYLRPIPTPLPEKKTKKSSVKEKIPLPLLSSFIYEENINVLRRGPGEEKEKGGKDE